MKSVQAIPACWTAVFICGCAASKPTDPASDPAAIRPDRLDLSPYYDQALREYQHAGFIKPGVDQVTGRLFDMAPLIVQQVGPGQTAVPPTGRFRAMHAGEIKGVRADAQRYAVYVITGVASIHGRVYDQLIYFWLYPPAPGESRLTWRGIRLTLDATGMADVTEVLNPDSPVRQIYVNKSLEESAAREFGPPLQGRRFSVEPDIETFPTLVVPRILDDGPIPMGPFVFLDAAERGVTTLLCRCMPSQVREFVENTYYDVIPIRAAEELGVPGFTSQELLSGHAPAQAISALRIPREW